MKSLLHPSSVRYWTCVTLSLLATTLVAATGFTHQLPSYPSGAEDQIGKTQLPSLVLGEWRTTPTYVDTGPFAAAEEHAYWTPTGPQFVVVTNKFEGLYNNGTPCSISRVQLRVNTGAEYALAEADPPEGNGKWPDEVRRRKWTFIVKPGENPVSLAIIRPAHDTEKCANGFDSPWPKLGTDRVALPLVGLPSRNDLGNFAQHSVPLRFGQLEIRVNAAGLATKEWVRDIEESTRHGHHEMVLSFALKNVTKYPNCTALWSGRSRLFDNRGYEYSGNALGEIGYGLSDLLPDGITGGNARFETWDGTAPRLLSITRDVVWERDCAQRQHRPVDMHGGLTVRIPIESVPVYPALSDIHRLRLNLSRMATGWFHQTLDLIAFGRIYSYIHREKDAASQKMPGLRHRVVGHQYHQEYGKLWNHDNPFPRYEMEAIQKLKDSEGPDVAEARMASDAHDHLDRVWDGLPRQSEGIGKAALSVWFIIPRSWRVGPAWM